MSAPRYETQAERDAGAAELGAELARLAAAAGVALPAPSDLAWCWAKFESDSTPDAAGPGSRAHLRWLRDGSAPHLTLSRGPAVLAQGGAPDLTAAVRTASTWLAGADLTATHRAAPFLHVEDWAFVHERTPLGPVELEWRLLLQRFEHSAHPWPEFLKPLWEAAFAEPQLRRLYPVTSHYLLWFSTTTDFPFERVGAAIQPFSDGGYLVRARRAEPAAETTGTTVASVGEAVALAVAALPPELG
ncbi:DUF6193 family natural product biosynthesis protein [Kitasatospora sp. NPDC088391]|uniref:DUF6193 family natural product biosynthesis protein n=1 Tax=Kitasatospora sp. NPDC088391 TaxID=3364074 RepID=UPI0037F98176